MSRLFVVTDTHNTSNPAHEYRWSYLSEVKNWISEPKIHAGAFLGDAFDAKDNHPSALINRFVDAWAGIAALGKPIIFMMGNHCYIDRTQPFLRFLQHIPNIIYVDSPQKIAVDGYKILAVPHGFSWDEDAPWRRQYPLNAGWDLILAHQTFCGAKVNGITLDKGPSPGLISKEATNGAPVISGDIHQAQTFGNLTYVGSPHPVSFGEQGGRFLTYDFEDRKIREIKRSSIARAVCTFVLRDDGSVLDDVEFASLKKGDHIQIRITASHAALVHFPALRERLQHECETRGIQIFKLQTETLDFQNHVESLNNIEVRTEKEIFDAFCDANNISDDLIQTGLSYVNF